MRREEFEGICRAAQSGEDRFVQNIDLLYTGKVVACGEDRVTVEAFGHRFEWEAERCQPTIGGSNPLGPPTNV